MILRKLTLLLLLVTASSIFAQKQIDGFLQKADDFFYNNVKEGKLDFETISKDTSEIDDILSTSNNFEVIEEEYKAFWIDLYNLIVVKQLAKNYPKSSPKEIEGFYENTFHVGKKDVTLNTIKNKFLNEKYNDPRVEFALVYGSEKCTSFVGEAYFPLDLEEQLNDRAKK